MSLPHIVRQVVEDMHACQDTGDCSRAPEMQTCEQTDQP